jgi:3-methyladenine DNA glycosylase AlkD
MTKKVLQQLKQEMADQSNEAIALSTQRFFKNEIQCIGIKAADLKLLSRKYYRLLDKPSKVDVFKLCEILWKSGIQEEAMVACDWSYRQKKNFLENDLPIFEKWITKYITNWATCDTFCNNSVGSYIMQYPDSLPKLFAWAKSKNTWMRRAAAVSLIIPGKRGLFTNEILKIASILLKDPDDMVQKGYGWMLKVSFEKQPDRIIDFVLQNKQKMPRTALRYAIEKWPANLKIQAMAK